MATISLSGLPANCSVPRLAVLLKKMLKKQGIGRFWIKEMADIRGTNLKCAKIELSSGDEAFTAMKVLDGFGFNNGEYDFPLTARVDDDDRGRPRRRSPSPYYYRSRDREYQDRYEEPRSSRYDGYLRDRSRSPIHREASKLDMEIELLRKQRMIIEEERRILLERKKLELVKEFGPSALKEFKSLEDDRDRDRDRGRDRRYRAERGAEYRPRRPSPRAWPAPRQNQPRPPKERSHLPQFALPCKLLLEELKETMEKLGTRKESFLLTKLIRATIRKRLAVALAGKPIMSAAKIKNLYREKYPSHQDEDFVKKHLKDLRACHLPSKGDDAKETAEKPETEKAEEQENNEVEEKVETDTNSNPDAASVKTEADDETNLESTEADDETNLESKKEEPNTSADTQALENDNQLEQTENPDQPERAECNRSVASSEALTLHDKNDEDWVEGEHDWDDANAAGQPAQE